MVLRTRVTQRWCRPDTQTHSKEVVGIPSVDRSPDIQTNMCMSDLGRDCQIVIEIYKQWPTLPPPPSHGSRHKTEMCQYSIYMRRATCDTYKLPTIYIALR